MSVNVNRDVTDVFYRYKMPRIIAKVEGKGNGIKTVIVNMVDVAKALGRPPTYPTKFFGCELGAQTQFDFKNDRYIVNGSHEASKLQSLLDIFVKKFVLCPKCDNPETELYPSERKGLIKQTCKACGNLGLVDMTHKLTTFILKNHPDVKPQQQGRSLTRKKDRKKEPEKNGQSKNLLRPNSPSMPEHSDNSDTDVNGVTEDDEEWTVCLSKEAVCDRMNDISSGVMNLAMSNDMEKSQGERLEIFYGYCKNKIDNDVLKPGAAVAVFREIASEADRLDIKETKGVMVLVELLLDENAIKLILQYDALFLIFTRNNDKSQKYLLGAMEKLIDLHKDTLLPRVPGLFKVLYDRDIIDEETFLEWGKKTSKKYVSKEVASAIKIKAEPFLKWLREADVESSSSEDDLEIEYSERALPQSLKEQEEEKMDAQKNKMAVAALDNLQEDENASDVDIDNL